MSSLETAYRLFEVQHAAIANVRRSVNLGDSSTEHDPKRTLSPRPC
jgi:hypothetical protein